MLLDHCPIISHERARTLCCNTKNSSTGRPWQTGSIFGQLNRESKTARNAGNNERFRVSVHWDRSATFPTFATFPFLLLLRFLNINAWRLLRVCDECALPDFCGRMSTHCCAESTFTIPQLVSFEWCCEQSSSCRATNPPTLPKTRTLHVFLISHLPN